MHGKFTEWTLSMTLMYMLVRNACLILLFVRPALAVDSLANIAAGRIRGASGGAGSAVIVYRGIPYAAPPTGGLRWRPPQPVTPWAGIRDCKSFGPSCLQPAQRLLSGIEGKQSEDCLCLNVWTSARPGDKRPVMVFVHGGGFGIGSGAQHIYDGLHFAEGGVVLVTFNYRLGPFGFLAHPALEADNPEHSCGNYGILDQIAALKWVQRNIAAFGGDPGNVTVFGESAGGVSVGCLLASPLASGLFQRAIIESGVPVNLPALREKKGQNPSGESTGIDIARQLGIADPASGSAATAKSLRDIPADSLLVATQQRVGLFGKGRRLGPVVDGYVIPRPPEELFASGQYNQVPVLLGSNADEGTLFLAQIPVTQPVGYRLLVRKLTGEQSEEVLRMFPANSAEEVRPAIAHLVTVAAFVAPTRRVARLLSSHRAPVWLYHFTRIPPGLKQRNLGATHGAELFYVFANIPPWARSNDTDLAVAGTIHRTWMRFAATGDPNGDDLPLWPAFTQEDDTHMEFGDQVLTGKGLFREECDLFDQISHRNMETGDVTGDSPDRH